MVLKKDKKTAQRIVKVISTKISALTLPTPLLNIVYGVFFERTAESESGTFVLMTLEACLDDTT